MSELQSKLISYAEIFRIAATHIYGDPSLIEFIPDENNEIIPPKLLRKKSLEAKVRLSLLHAKHKETVDSLRSENDAEARDRLRKRRDELQAQIHETGPHIQSEPQLREYENRFEKQNHAAFVRAIISNACADGKIPLFLNSEIRLPQNILAPGSSARFLPKESILECEIDGEWTFGIVGGDEEEVRQQFKGKAAMKPVSDNPQSRREKCEELLTARLDVPETHLCTKAEHLMAIKPAVPGLLQKEFDWVRRKLSSKYPILTARGRRPKTRPKA